MKTWKRAVAIGWAMGVVSIIGLGTMPAQATEGYFAHGYGAVSKALAGTGAAYSQDAMSQALNPAGLANVDSQLNIGISLFSPSRLYRGSGTTSGAGLVPNAEIRSDSRFFLIPDIAASYRIDDVSAVGVAVYANGGMNTNYDDSGPCIIGLPGVFCNGTAGVDLAQLFLQPTYAYEFFDRVSVGAGPIFALQTFEANGLGLFAALSSDPNNLTNEGHDLSYGFGGRVGMQVAMPANVRLGAAYQFRTYMTEFDHYKGLFAEQGDFDIPAAVQAGISWKPRKDVTLLFDYRYIWYNDVNAVGNKFASPGLLGADNGRGFGWENTNIFKFGAQWEVDSELTLRAGYSYTNQPIPSSEMLFNILAPAVIRHHITAGATIKLSDTDVLHVGGMFAPNSTQSGPNAFDPPQGITLEMYQLELSVGWSRRF